MHSDFTFLWYIVLGLLFSGDSVLSHIKRKAISLSLPFKKYVTLKWGGTVGVWFSVTHRDRGGGDRIVITSHSYVKLIRLACMFHLSLNLIICHHPGTIVDLIDYCTNNTGTALTNEECNSKLDKVN